MLSYIKSLFKALKNIKEQSVSVKGKLLLSLLSMVLVAFGILIIGFIATGVIFNPNKRIEDTLSLQLKNDKSQIKNEFDSLTTQGIELSRNLSRETQQFLTEKRIKLKDLNNNEKYLQALQEKYYAYLDTALQISDSSGSYAIINATTNTKLSYAKESRSGLYLRVKNIDLTEKANQEKVLYRGIPQVGRKKALELGTQWTLEFDISNFPEFIEIIKNKNEDILSSYKWRTRSKLSNMWDEAVYLLLPFTGSDGTNYGVCGLEISEAIFELTHPAVDSEFGQLVSTLAPIDQDGIHLKNGLVGERTGTYLTDQQILSKTEKIGNLVKYTSENESYVGLEDEINISSTNDQLKWAVCVLMPYSSYQKIVSQDRMKWNILSVVFLLVMIVLAIFISKTYVQPLLESNQIPPDVEKMFDKMIENMKKLTTAERRILYLYIEGHEIGEIPDIAFISMATVRKHNRNIYEKLEVASKDELMVYIDLFRKFGRIGEIMPKENNEKV